MASTLHDNAVLVWEPATLFYTYHVRKNNGTFLFRILLGIAKNHFLSFTEGILGGPYPLQKSKFQFSYTHRVAIQKWLQTPCIGPLQLV